MNILSKHGSKLLALALCFFVNTQSLTQGATAQETKQRTLAYRTGNKWVAKHFHDASQIDSHVKTLKQLKCEVKKMEHNGHTDVQARSVMWKAIVIKDDEQLKQWKAWFGAAGLEALSATPVKEGAPTQKDANGKPLDVVQFRTVKPVTIHAHQPGEAGQLKIMYGALGCEIESNKHGGHTDVKIECPKWMEIALPTHEIAHKWQEFLDKAGFETKHSH